MEWNSWKQHCVKKLQGNKYNHLVFWWPWKCNIMDAQLLNKWFTRELVHINHDLIWWRREAWPKIGKIQRCWLKVWGLGFALKKSLFVNVSIILNFWKMWFVVHKDKGHVYKIYNSKVENSLCSMELFFFSDLTHRVTCQDNPWPPCTIFVPLWIFNHAWWFQLKFKIQKIYTTHKFNTNINHRLN
jgi:hypothetical protein